MAQALTRESVQSRDARVHGQPSQLQRKPLQQPAYLRLLARLETMPVIEQAKGILMAQSGRSEADAFDLLRRASQRSNVPVRELAAQLVATTVQAAPDVRRAG